MSSSSSHTNAQQPQQRIHTRLPANVQPIPSSSSLPHRSASASTRTINPGPGHSAASYIPAVTHVKRISSKLDAQLRQDEVYTKIRDMLGEYLKEEGLSREKQEEIVEVLRGGTRSNASGATTAAGLFGDMIHGGGGGVTAGPQLAFGYQSAEGDGNSSVAALSSASRILPNRRYLNVRLRHGRAFVDQLLPSENTGSDGSYQVLRVSIEFLGQRCLSVPVPATVEPEFDESFLFRVDKEKEEEREVEAQSGMITMEQLAELNHPLHILVLRESSLGTTTLVSSAYVEWRKVLVHGRVSLNVELKGGDDLQLPLGLLSLDLEIVPLRMPPSPTDLPVFIELTSLTQQFTRDTELTRGLDLRFHTYAKAWWNDYCTIRPIHSTRLITIFGMNEFKQEKCVCTYLSPLRVSRGGNIDTPLHAARFVRLIPYVKETRVGGARKEIWNSVHTILAKRCGDVEDHCIMLCSLLLGFGLDAYVAVGLAKEKGAHMWVMTRGQSSGKEGVWTITMWESLTGQRYEVELGKREPHTSSSSSSSSTSKLPFTHLHCVFNHISFYANNQLSDLIPELDYNFSTSTSAWKPMNMRAISVLPKREAVFLRAPSMMNAIAQEELEMERRLKELVRSYRREYGNYSTTFSSDFSYILGPALSAYEYERITGEVYGNAEFQQAIKRTVPTQSVFKAVPFQFTTRNVSILFSSLLQSVAMVDLLTSDGDQLRFGLRCKIVKYAEDFTAVWIMLATIKKAEDILAQPMPMLP